VQQIEIGPSGAWVCLWA